MRRLAELLRRYRAKWKLAQLAFLLLAWVALEGCGPDLPRADIVKTSGDAVACVQHVTAAMRTAPDCPSKLRAADLVAQTDKACAAADLIDLGLVCPDGGAGNIVDSGYTVDNDK